MNLFAGHTASIMDEARPKEVRLYWTDTQVNQIDVVRSAADLRRVMGRPIKGGGGTNMPIGVQAAVADKCDIIIVLTDGYTPFCDAPVPLIWAITTQVTATGNGKTIHITK